MNAERAEDLAKRIAANAERATAGRNVLLVGPPGAGKTMIARRVVNYLPRLGDLERTWLLAEWDAAGLLTDPYTLTPRPFRAPHYTASVAALVGKTDRRHRVTCASRKHYANRCDCEKELVSIAGEATLARFGVLYLDELTEFSASTLGALAHRLDAMGTTAPLVIASANPCPCGRRGYDTRPNACVCSEKTVEVNNFKIKSYGEILGCPAIVEVA